MDRLQKPRKTPTHPPKMFTPFQNLNLPNNLHKYIALIKQYAWRSILSLILLLTAPLASYAGVQEYNIVTDEFYGLNAERVLLVPTAEEADQIILMTGKCKSRGATELYLEDDPVNAREKWFIISEVGDFKPDKEICLTGNLPAWFEKVAFVK